MPPARRRKPATPKEEPTMTTTEAIDTDPETDADVAPEDVQEDAATRERRAAARPEDAIFLTQFTVAAPPKTISARKYEPTAYDEVLEQMWQRYQDEGSQPWSLSGVWTKEDKPATGWWADRDDIYMTTVVPDYVNAESLIRRAANHIGCSYRFKVDRDETTKEPRLNDDGGYQIWFTAAPILKKKTDE